MTRTQYIALIGFTIGIGTFVLIYPRMTQFGQTKDPMETRLSLPAWDANKEKAMYAIREAWFRETDPAVKAELCKDIIRLEDGYWGSPSDAVLVVALPPKEACASAN